jgi:hypothetical protein
VIAACPPTLICAGPPPAPPALIRFACPRPSRRYPRVECITANGRVIVRVWRRR